MSADAARGFSLVELLVVMAIAALLVSTVAFSLGRESDADGQALDIAEDVTQLIGIASNRAVVMAQPLGMHLRAPENMADSGWQIEWSRWRNGQWQIDDDMQLQAELPQSLQLELWVEEQPVDLARRALQSRDELNEPVLVMYPTGETTSFTLQLSVQTASGETQTARVATQDSGLIETQW
jgi:prepilin-type N-terminal cleavage/methylation domain-containing protein